MTAPQPRERADTDLDDRVLRHVLLKGAASTETLAQVLDNQDTATVVLARLHRSGLITQADNEAWSVTPAGRASASSCAERERAATGTAVGQMLDTFGPVNLRCKSLLTDYQRNDVEDGDALHSFLDGIASTVHAPVTAMLLDTAEALPRLLHYIRRLDRALERARMDRRYVAHPLWDSYHTVWFEMHEDLLRTAGRTRSRSEA